MIAEVSCAGCPPFHGVVRASSDAMWTESSVDQDGLELNSETNCNWCRMCMQNSATSLCGFSPILEGEVPLSSAPAHPPTLLECLVGADKARRRRADARRPGGLFVHRVSQSGGRCASTRSPSSCQRWHGSHSGVCSGTARGRRPSGTTTSGPPLVLSSELPCFILAADPADVAEMSTRSDRFPHGARISATSTGRGRSRSSLAAGDSAASAGLGNRAWCRLRRYYDNHGRV